MKMCRGAHVNKEDPDLSARLGRSLKFAVHLIVYILQYSVTS